LEALIRETCRGLSTAQLTQRLEAADVAYGELRTVQGLLEHPQLAARDRWRRVDSPVGPLLALLPPFSVPAEEPLLGPVPRLGEHTESVLREIGMEPEEVRP
jgi:crotonobetainyl-CoA:carnitine CoA-transferase CaiB-like acyl-CoA transferase